jgi:hypothetical protein
MGVVGRVIPGSSTRRRYREPALVRDEQAPVAPDLERLAVMVGFAVGDSLGRAAVLSREAATIAPWSCVRLATVRTPGVRELSLPVGGGISRPRP